MKKLFKLTVALALLGGIMSFNYGPKPEKNINKITLGTNYDATFENKCSKDVKLRMEYSGGANETNMYKNASEKRSFQAGYKVYIDGKFFREMLASDAGKSFVICS